MYISENSMPGSAPASVPGPAVQVCAVVPMSAISTAPFSSRWRFSFLFDYSVANLDLSQSSRKTPAATRKAVLLTLPPPGKAHTGPQRASHRRSLLSLSMPKASPIYWLKPYHNLVYNLYWQKAKKEEAPKHFLLPTCGIVLVDETKHETGWQG